MKRGLSVAFIAAVCVMSSFAQSPKQVPRPKPANKSSQQKKTAPQQPAPVVINQYTTTQNNTAASKKTGTPDNDGSQKWITRSAIVQAVSAFIVASLTFALLWYSHRGWEVAKVSADAAKKSANAAEAALNKVERAYLVVMFQGVGTKNHFGEQAMSIIFSIFNSGHTPAKIQTATAHAIVGERWPPKPDYSLPSRMEFSGAGLTIAPVRDIAVSFDLTAAEISDVASNDPARRLHIYGQVLYTDVLGEGHFVRFGRRYMPGDIASPFHYPDVPGYEDAD